MNSHSELIDAIIPIGEDKPTFQLYCVKLKALDTLGNIAVIWPADTKFNSFVLDDDWWPVAIELFEISPSCIPGDLERVLQETLSEMTKRGCELAWFMFDGVFMDISDLFTEWSAKSIYGIVRSSTTPTLALDEELRESDIWRKIILDVSDWFYSCYPIFKEHVIE